MDSKMYMYQKVFSSLYNIVKVNVCYSITNIWLFLSVYSIAGGKINFYLAIIFMPLTIYFLFELLKEIEIDTNEKIFRKYLETIRMTLKNPKVCFIWLMYGAITSGLVFAIDVVMVREFKVMAIPLIFILILLVGNFWTIIIKASATFQKRNILLEFLGILVSGMISIALMLLCFIFPILIFILPATAIMCTLGMMYIKTDKQIKENL